MLWDGLATDMRGHNQVGLALDTHCSAAQEHALQQGLYDVCHGVWSPTQSWMRLRQAAEAEHMAYFAVWYADAAGCGK